MKTLHAAWTEMLGTNCTVQDLAGSLAAVAAFTAVLYAPGYLLAWVVDLFEFRRRSLAERICWAMACSLGVMPIVVFLAGRWAGIGAVCWVTCALAAVVGFLAWRGRGVAAWTRRERWWAASIAFGWIIFVLFSLVDVQVGRKLYFSVVVFDQSYRVAFTDAVSRTGIPPANPLYFAGHAQPMHYYYFWYVLCAMVMRIAHVTARQAFIASSVWAGFGLVATIALYVRHFLGVTRSVKRQILVAVTLLAITGADLLPAVGSLFAQRALNGEMEWWSIDQFYSWQDSLLWVPHHTAGLLCCLLSFLLLWRTREGVYRKQRWVAVGIAGASCASAFGLSIYVACGFAFLALAWVFWVWVRDRGQLRLVVNTAVAGCVSLLLLVPLLRELIAGAGGATSTRHVFALSVRRMIDPELLTSLPVFTAIRQAHPEFLDTVMRLLLLPPGLALELGFYGAVLWVMLLRGRRIKDAGREEPLATAIFLSICGLVMVVFVRSSVMSQNDFGYRAAMLPQFFLLLLGGNLVMSWGSSGGGALAALTKLQRSVVMGLLLLGLAGTVYQGLMLRGFLPLEAARAGSGFEHLPEEAFEAREAFAALNRVTANDATVQVNAMDATGDSNGDVVPPHQFLMRTLLMDSGRQVLNLEPECATAFGGDTSRCSAIQKATEQLYGSPAILADAAVKYCQDFGVDDLVVSPTDAAWNDKGGWVWTLPVVAGEPRIRIVRCR